MKKYTFYFVLIAVLIIVLNIYFNASIYRNQISFQRSILLGQAESSVDEIENALMKFENEVNALLFSNSLLGINISSDDSHQDGLRSLQMLFDNNSAFIKNITIYDSNKNVLNLSYNKKNTLLIDPYITQQQSDLKEKEIIIQSGNQFIYTFPVFAKNSLIANISFTLDPSDYFQSVFNHYFHNDAFWQWIINDSADIVFSNAKEPVDYMDLSFIMEDNLNDLSGFNKHAVRIGNHSEKLFTAYTPLDIFNKRFGVAFSMRKSFVFDLIFNRIIISGVFSTLIIIAFFGVLLGRFGQNILQSKKSNMQLSAFQSIFDNLPVGILVLDQNQDIKIMNLIAKEMLLLRQDEILSGKNLIDRFMLSKDYYDTTVESAFDSNQFVLYKNEGEEVVVFKKDHQLIIENEEYVLSAIVDVTQIEKARKYEAAANTAKSEFLARMSHEIRTPMNGIIGMTEALDHEDLTSNQKEYVQIVRRSADVLLTLIDDILDFSKIEAGKMQLEEIPFRLREEIKYAVELFRPIIEEKHLLLELKIDPDIPDNIIGDPFRLRQVLSNLISNAVKFTHEGKILVGIDLEEEYNSNLTLLFFVEDTGVGIPRNKIESIFNSFTQAEASTSRKYGGSGLGTTIAKQLVTLMHGEMWVQSPSTISKDEKYPGSRFSFTIEVYSNERLIKQISSGTISKISQLNTLLITSSPVNKQRLLRLFEYEKIPCDVFQYSNDNQADLINHIQHPEKDYQLIILFDEPGMNGFQVAKKLNELNITKNHLFFILSTNHKPENYILSKKLGIDFYLIEPFEQSDFFTYLYETFPNIEKSSGENVRLIKSDLSVLVAEDNEINIKVAQTIFANFGIKIDIARNGNEAIEKVRIKEYDIVFMDLVMPERDGIQATVEIRGLGYQMPIIAMTATASFKTRSKAIATGMNDYMVKPVKIDSVKNVLLKWFA